MVAMERRSSHPLEAAGGEQNPQVGQVQAGNGKTTGKGRPPGGLQQLTAGKTQRVNEKWWVHGG